MFYNSLLLFTKLGVLQLETDSSPLPDDVELPTSFDQPFHIYDHSGEIPPGRDDLQKIIGLVGDPEICKFCHFEDRVSVECGQDAVSIRLLLDERGGDLLHLGRGSLQFLLWNRVLGVHDRAFYGQFVGLDPELNDEVWTGLEHYLESRSTCAAIGSGPQVAQRLEEFFRSVYTLSLGVGRDMAELARSPQDAELAPIYVEEEVLIDGEDLQRYRDNVQRALDSVNALEVEEESAFMEAMGPYYDATDVHPIEIPEELKAMYRRLVSLKKEVARTRSLLSKSLEKAQKSFWKKRRFKEPLSDCRTRADYAAYMSEIGGEQSSETVEYEGRRCLRVDLSETHRRYYPLDPPERRPVSASQTAFLQKIHGLLPFPQDAPVDPERVLGLGPLIALARLHGDGRLMGRVRRAPQRDLHVMLVGDPEIIPPDKEAPYRSLMMPLMKRLLPQLDLRFPEQRLEEGPQGSTELAKRIHQTFLRELMRGGRLNPEALNSVALVMESSLAEIHRDPSVLEKWGLTDPEWSLLRNIINGKARRNADYDELVMKILRRYGEIQGCGGVLVCDALAGMDDASLSVLKRFSREPSSGELLAVWAIPSEEVSEEGLSLEVIQHRLDAFPDQLDAFEPSHFHQLRLLTHTAAQNADYAAAHALLTGIVERYFGEMTVFEGYVRSLSDLPKEDRAATDEPRLRAVIALTQGLVEQGLRALEDGNTGLARLAALVSTRFQAYFSNAVERGEGRIPEEDVFASEMALYQDRFLVMMSNYYYGAQIPALDSGSMTRSDRIRTMLETRYFPSVGAQHLKVLQRSPASYYAQALMRYRGGVSAESEAGMRDQEFQRVLSIATVLYAPSLLTYAGRFDEERKSASARGLEFQERYHGLAGLAPVTLFEETPRIKMEILRLAIHAATRVAQSHHEACAAFRSGESPEGYVSLVAAEEAYNQVMEQYDWMVNDFEAMVDDGHFISVSRLHSYYSTLASFAVRVPQDYDQAIRYLERAEQLIHGLSGYEVQARRTEHEKDELIRVRLSRKIDVFKATPSELRGEVPGFLGQDYRAFLQVFMAESLLGEEEAEAYYQMQYYMTAMQALADFLALDSLCLAQRGGRPFEQPLERLQFDLRGEEHVYGDVLSDGFGRAIQDMSERSLGIVMTPRFSQFQVIILTEIRNHLASRLECVSVGDERHEALQACFEAWDAALKEKTAS